MKAQFVPLVYDESCEEKLIGFLKECLPQSGRALDINGRHSFYNDIENSFEAFRVMYDGDDIIGTVGVRRLNANDCELKSLYLLEKYHGRGYGKALLSDAVSYAKAAGFEKMYLDTFSTSTKAVGLYRSCGFRECERYNDNERSDVFMCLDLTM